jgi:nicotinate-nucleotide pyrophosphorylase (carboxylating)
MAIEAGRTRSLDVPWDALARVVELALAEDLGSGDVTSEGLFPAGTVCRAELLLKEPGVISGLPAVEAVMRALDADIEVEPLQTDGARIGIAPAVIARVSGPAGPIMSGERTALNLLGRLSGIATMTRRYVDAVAGTRTVVLDTRKTTAGLRELEKYAVRCGGGTNHRLGLYDGILVKDNHLRIVGGVTEAVRRLRAAGSGLPIEIECETLEEVREALAAGADRLLLDNMTLGLLREAVELTAGRVSLEASGGVTLETIEQIAATGVDFVSVGALTHSARALDVSLEISR